MSINKQQHTPAPFLERLIFNNRPAVILICTLISLFLFYQAAQVRPSTSFEKMIRAAVAEFPNFKVAATTLRKATTATFNDWSALLYYQGQLYQSMKRDNLEIYDRVGGGDSFGGGLIYSLLTGKSTQEAVEFAVAASALKHSIEGDYNMMTVSEVEKLAGGDGSGRIQR